MLTVAMPVMETLCSPRRRYDLIRINGNLCKLKDKAERKSKSLCEPIDILKLNEPQKDLSSLKLIGLYVNTVFRIAIQPAIANLYSLQKTPLNHRQRFTGMW